MLGVLTQQKPNNQSKLTLSDTLPLKSYFGLYYNYELKEKRRKFNIRGVWGSSRWAIRDARNVGKELYSNFLFCLRCMLRSVRKCLLVGTLDSSSFGKTVRHCPEACVLSVSMMFGVQCSEVEMEGWLNSMSSRPK